MGKVTQPLFNSPFELGIRMVYLLAALRPYGADLQKLVLLDYAVVYSSDLGGPESLHTPVPHRGGELLSRRELIEQGLFIMSTRGLVEVEYGEEGISYLAGPNALTMVGSLFSKYYLDLETRCKWVSQEYASSNSSELTNSFAHNGHLWGAEVEAFLDSGDRQWPSD